MVRPVVGPWGDPRPVRGQQKGPGPFRVPGPHCLVVGRLTNPSLVSLPALVQALCLVAYLTVHAYASSAFTTHFPVAFDATIRPSAQYR